MMKQCKSCKAKDVAQSNMEIDHKGATLSVPVAYTVCRKCHKESITVEQIIKNDKAIREAKLL